MLYAGVRMRSISRDLIAATRADVDAGRASFDDVGRIRQMVEADAAAFNILIFPELIRFADYPYAAIVDALRDYCREQRIAVVDLLPALATHRDADLWVHETDHHPNPTAHAVAAAELLKVLK
jgi:hypothetical protein